MEFWNIGTGRQGDAQFVYMRGVLIILCDTFANLCRCDANDGVGGSVVVGISAEYFYSQSPFLYIVLFSCQGLFRHKAQECREPLAVAEEGIFQEPSQLLTDGNLLRFGQSCACLVLHSCRHCMAPYSRSDYTAAETPGLFLKCKTYKYM